MRISGSRSVVSVLALVSSSMLALGAASQAASSPSTASDAAPAAAVGTPLGADAVAVARRHVAKHAADYGLSDADVKQLAVSSVVPTEHNGLTNVYLQQRLHSIDVSTAILNVAVSADGKVFRVASSAVASAGKLANGATPKLSDVAAAERAADALGLRPTKSFASDDSAQGASRQRTLTDGGISRDPVTARLVYQQTDSGDLRLAWELGINQLDGKHWWQIRMDAGSGEELGRTDWVAADSHRVYPLPTEAPSFGGRVLVSNPANATASPFGWNDTNGVAGAESTLTIGNNVEAYTDLNDDDAPDAGSSPDGGAGLVFDFPLDLTQPPSAYRPAAVSNLYFTINRIHDILYRYGFNEASGNFQVNNYGKGGVGNDSVNGEAQDGGGTNNANFATPPDGQEPRMQMYVWTDATPDVDGDLDNGVIIHEFGHGVSNRLTGGPANVNCLNNDEQAGEGWSDYLAYMLTMPNGTEPAGGRGIGTYALGEPTTGAGIRNQKYSTSMAINTSTYDTIKSAGSPHDVGEVWAEMLWEVTYALIDEHGFDANLITGNAGNNISLQLVMDGMKLQPCSPGFVDARDAIIDADLADNAGANKCILWTAFAKRGLGVSAVQGSTNSVTDGTEAFDLPPDCQGVELTADATPSPVPAGKQLTYALHVENVATHVVSGVVATSEIGDHASFVAGSATCGGTFNAGTETVTFPIGSIGVGVTRNCQFKALIDGSPFSTTAFSDDFEPDMSAWVATHGAGGFDWTHTTLNPHSPTHVAAASEPASVSDQYLALANPVTVAAGDSLAFWHTRGFENGFDGGIVEVSTNSGGSWTNISGAAFTANGYNGTISTSWSSPIAGQQAFTGTSPYVKSVASLAAYVGQSILVRFRAASDVSVGGSGWFVDDVVIGRDVNTTNHMTVSATGFPNQALDMTTQIVAPTGTAPGAPTVTGSTPSSGAVSVAFSPPASNGGNPITSYTASCVSTDGGVTKNKTGPASPLLVTDLTNGKHYHCRVRATNVIGPGPFSAYGATVLVVVTTVPGAPAVTSSTPVAGAVNVAFNPPASNGGSPITSYTAQCLSTNGGLNVAKVGLGSPLQVANLSAGKSYHCRVRATNAVGPGPYGAFGATVVIPAAVVPGSPAVTASTPAAGAVTVAFTAPANNGGSPITSYTVQCLSTDGGVNATKTGAASPLQVTNLSAGKSYHCRARATNAVGAGAYGAFGATVVIPAAVVPGSPAVTASTPSAGAVTVAFTAPANNGGSPITSYTAQCLSTDGGIAKTKTGVASPLQVTGLTSAKHYHCRMKATNAVGPGAYGAYGATVLVT